MTAPRRRNSSLCSHQRRSSAELVRDVAGEGYSRLELNALVQRVVVTDHPRQAAEELAGRFAWHLTGLNNPVCLESVRVWIDQRGARS